MAGDCGPGERCLEGRCVPGALRCARLSDCPEGEACLGGRCEAIPEGSSCERCAGPGSCGPTSICAPISGEALSCLALCQEGSCGPGQRCVLFDDVIAVCLDALTLSCEPAGCGDDPFEPNNRVEAAATPPAGEEPFFAFSCEEDWDFFDLSARDIIPDAIELIADQPLTVQLLDALGALIREERVEAESPQTFPRGDARWVALRTDAPGSYLVTLLGGTAPPPCEDDGLEQNDEPARALPIGFGAMLQLRLCPGDPDWLRLPQRANERLQLLSPEILRVGALSPG